MRRRWRSRVVLAIGVLAIAAGASWTFGEWRFEAGLARARGDLEAGRFEAARGWLASQPTGRPEDAEIAYLLGLCERRMGRPKAAVDDWSRVPLDSRLGGDAAEARRPPDRGTRSVRRGGGGPARPWRAGRSPAAARFRYALARLLFWEGRLDEMRRLSQEGWDSSPDRAGDLYDLWRIDHAPPTFEPIEAAVERAAAAAPDEDRVWLAPPTWRCTPADSMRRRGGSTPACRVAPTTRWSARPRLQWAQSTGRLDEVLQCLSHLPADRFTEEEVLSLRAWIAERRGRPDAERAALERLIERVPGNSRRWSGWRRWRSPPAIPTVPPRSVGEESEADRSQAKYYRTLEGPEPSAHAAELAALAEALGLGFDARAWWTLAARDHPGDPAVAAACARLGPPRPDRPAGGEGRRLTLAEVVNPDAVPAIAGPAEGRPPGAPPASTPTQPARARADSGCRRSATTPRRRASASSSTTADRPEGRSPRPPRAVSACSITTATAGSTSTSSRGGRSRPGDDASPDGDRLFRNRRRRHLRGRHRTLGHRRVARRLWPRRGRRRLRQRRPSRPVRHPLAVVCPLSQPGRRHVRGRHRTARAGRRSRLADLGRLRRPRRRRRPRPLRLPLPRLGPRAPDALPRARRGRTIVTIYCDSARLPGRCPITSSATTAAGSSTSPPRRDRRQRRPGPRRRGRRPRRRRPARPVRRQRHDGQLTSSTTWAGSGSRSRPRSRASPATPTGATRRAWASPAATSTATAGPTWPSPTSTASRPRSSGTSAAASSPTRPPRSAWPRRAGSCLGFGVAFLDANNDGRLDLAHRQRPRQSTTGPTVPLAMPLQLLLGGRGGRLTDITAAAGRRFWTSPISAEGWPSATSTTTAASTLLVTHRQRAAGLPAQPDARAAISLTFALEGTTVEPRRAWARGDRHWPAASSPGWRNAWAAAAIQSCDDPRLHFGLEAATRIERVEVRWPSGQVDRFRDLAVDRGYRLREGVASRRH